ncbi:MAG TPA: YqgE/AlgH family protein [Acidimicrobiia bacterium]|nr:YqgE/AlgH family protein [Acidimicrobiia bacterium]
MREPRAGTLLVATPVLIDPNFHRSVVALLQHDDEGSLGVVLDRPTTIPVAEFLPEWAPLAAEPAVVFHGGPVEPEIGLGLRVLGGTIETVTLDHDPDDDSPVRVFSGYSGWSAGQLEQELSEGAWFVVDMEPQDVLTRSPDTLWSSVLRRQPGEISLFATFPLDPQMN